MSAQGIGPERGPRAKGDAAGRSSVAVLAGRRAAGVEGGGSADIFWFGRHFTPADHAALAAWVRDASHGYDRVHVDRGVSEDGIWASYALLYASRQAWSTWGVMRRDGRVELWRCATGKTMGHHARMEDALASLTQAEDHRRASPVAPEPLPVRAGRPRAERRGAVSALGRTFGPQSS